MLGKVLDLLLGLVIGVIVFGMLAAHGVELPWMRWLLDRGL